MVYGMEAIILIDLSKLTVKLVELVGVPREDLLEIFEEKCDNTTSYNCLYQASMRVRHEDQVKERNFQVKELVLKMASHVKGVARAIRHKFSPKWERPYIMEEAHQTGHYWLKD